MKTRTYQQVEAAKRKAELAAENLMEDDDLADEFAEMSVEQYAERKGILIQNPKQERKKNMATKREIALQEELEEAQARIEELEEERAGILQVMGLEEVDDDEAESDEEEDESVEIESDEEEEPPVSNGKKRRVVLYV